MHLGHLFGGALILSACASSAVAQDRDRVEIALERIQSAAQDEADAAQAEYDLVSATALAMHRALRAGGAVEAQAVDAGLEPLRQRHPDSRLTYSGREDRCQVLQAFGDIRSAAIERKGRALRVLASAFKQSELYYSVRAEVAYARLKGEPITNATVEEGFLGAIHVQEELSDLDTSDQLEVPESLTSAATADPTTSCGPS